MVIVLLLHIILKVGCICSDGFGYFRVVPFIFQSGFVHFRIGSCGLGWIRVFSCVFGLASFIFGWIQVGSSWWGRADSGGFRWVLAGYWVGSVGSWAGSGGFRWVQVGSWWVQVGSGWVHVLLFTGNNWTFRLFKSSEIYHVHNCLNHVRIK